MESSKKIEVNGKEYVVKKKGTAAAQPSMRISGHVITIRLPVSWPREELFRASLEMEREAIGHLKKNPEEPASMKKLEFSDGQKVEVMGKKFEVKVAYTQARYSNARLANEIIEIKVGNFPEETRKKHVSNLARRVISKAVLPEVRKRVEEINAQSFHETYRKIFLKDNMSNWGSCSENRNINLNFRLLFAPQSVLEYVITHELAHLLHSNHSKEFWGLVATARPDYEKDRNWLKENGEKLGIQENDEETQKTLIALSSTSPLTSSPRDL